MTVGPICLALLLAGPAPPERFGGRLEALVAGTMHLPVVTMEPASEEVKAGLPERPAAADRAYASRLVPGSSLGLLVLVVPPAAAPFVWVNLDDSSGGWRRFPFEPSRRLTQLESLGEVLVPLTRVLGPFRQHPILLILQAGETLGSPPVLRRSTWVYVDGSVDVAGRATLVRYQFNVREQSVIPTSGWVGMDVDGDGRIDDAIQAGEWLIAKDEPVIFRVGDRYLSTESVDLEARRIVIRSHDASEYLAIDAGLGAIVPDFPFRDASGRQRRLSNLRGKYVLLDFWATWCAPCIAELPNLREAYTRFEARGFEVVGISGDEDAEKARGMIAAKAIPWPQIVGAEAAPLVQRRFRIRVWPTTLLLDPEGRVVAAGDELRGAKLHATLEARLPRPR